jgi:hypothetical protein
VKIYPGEYIVAEERFSNLVEVEAQIKRTGAHALMLESCGPASRKRLVETIDRFRTVYADRIEVDALPANDSGCQPPTFERDAPRATFPWP